ncbi:MULTISPECIES: ABC transporter substrate-binding protein [unclassified Streptomyces]|uniref:ABC transporter substrate-binding protein n=1 Tax=unclassified Streptomyces TaxID=2593676 RepID=UPI001368F083|nr:MULTISPECIES: ABC transporter substrate-binding protein [unclassified Streptomyces]NDZ98405.1 ABC transporter substrate-binding protein [Streptomyces sp. SID10116]MYY87325.1 ABC transporter substrate-binding protein [Streptomyces sp. SID335]MYZ17716.1 ABC transporter substrate-binding protein [Streptomyces sp. SID337]NDZ91306.1 ABC transporter substrate-binding protein [Streptomyces sp. SID10115]NEB48152.1 ABC transporter substrate-binding protein [Streptomyces sp. SID339]
MRHTRSLALASALTAALALSGCGADLDPADDGAKGADKKTVVERCGEPVPYKVPRRAVAYEGGSADKLFSLGLTEHVHGYVMPPANPPVSESPWASEYAKVKMLSDDLLNKELVVEAESDFVVAGWNSGFSDQRGITPKILDKLGIQSFMHTESCFNYPGHPQKVTPFKALYSDLERLGKIFRVEEKADRVVGDLKKRVAAVEARAPEAKDGKRIPVFLYDSGTDQPFTAGSQVPPNDIIKSAGGRNIFDGLDERWTQVTWEAVTKAEPEVVIIFDYGDQPAKKKIEFLKKSPHTKELPAVKKNNFFVLDYNEGISGPRNIDGLEKFGKYLRGLEG